MEKYIWRVHFRAEAGHTTYIDCKTKNYADKCYGDKIGFDGWKSLRIETLDRKTMREVPFKDLIK